MNKDLISSDLEQRELALDPSHSFIVKAPAGSGKTELLTQRLLTLLSTVTKPEEILAITFTNKAANEMRQRIVKALQSSLGPKPDEAHKKKTWELAHRALQQDEKHNWNIINNPNRLRIQTIDSFCSYLTKQLPIVSGIGSSPMISLDPLQLYKDSVTNVLKHLHSSDEWGNAIRSALLHLDNDLNKLYQLLITMLSKRDQWLPYIHFEHSDHKIRSSIESTQREIIERCIATCENLLPNEEVTSIEQLLAFSRILEQKDAPNGDDLKDRQDYWLAITSLLLTNSGTWRKRVDKEIGFPTLTSLQNKTEIAEHRLMREKHKALIERMSPNEELRSQLLELTKLPPPNLTDYEWDVLCSLLKVLKISAAELRLTFQHQRKIDFIENAQAAVLALNQNGNPTDLALALDYQIKHILIDEFQDTSIPQLTLLQQLTAGWQGNDNKTLFIVGDPMQSIYRFREAEVSIFLDIWENGFGTIPITPITLSINFRSTNQIIGWNNQHFKRIFPRSSNQLSGAVTYSESITLNSNDNNEETDAGVFQFIKEEDSQGQNEAIVSHIQSTLNQHPTETIAILVRSRSHLETIVTLLSSKGIPFQAVEIDPLNEKQCIQDIYSLTKALHHLGDRIAWLSILRSPICGLTLQDLTTLTEKNRTKTIWSLITNEDIVSELSTHGQHHIKRIIPILKSALRKKDRIKLSELIEQTWLQLGYPATFTNQTDIEDTKAFINVLGDLTSYQPEELESTIKKLFATSNQNDAQVQIMTIHAAKGLEFDTVILPHLEKKSPNKDKPLFSWLDIPFSQTHVGLMMAPIQFEPSDKQTVYQFIQQQQNLKSLEETKRVLYVAVTRAKKRFYAYYSTTLDKDNKPRALPGSFLHCLLPSLNESDMMKVATDSDATQPHTTSQRLLKRLTTDWVNPINETLWSTAIHRKSSGFILPDQTNRILGTTFHILIENISNHGIDWWDSKSDSEKCNLISQILIGQHCNNSELTTARERISYLITNMLSDSMGNWILKQEHSKNEYSVTTFTDNQPEKLIIDKVFTDENNIRWIVDYKTAEPKNADIKTFIKSETAQYKDKMKRYAEALNQIEPKQTKLLLYFPALPNHFAWDWQMTALNEEVRL